MKAAMRGHIIPLTALTLAVACGETGKSSGAHKSTGGRLSREEATVDGANIEGHYQAKFVTMNPHVNGTIPGSVNFLRKGEQLYAYVRLFAGGVKTWHMQFVYTGGRCPTLRDDKNGDGFIDIAEAEAVTGKILIPLDSDIGTQSSGSRFYPIADLSGYYAYERIANFRRFLADLQEEDTNPDDDITKLGPGRGLTFVGKVAMVLGVPETIDLPETVATKEPRRAFQTLPVACGVFQKITQIPGSAVDDTQIGPTAPVIEGEDRPAPDETPASTTGGASGGGDSSTGANDSDDGHGPTTDGESHRTSGSSGASTGATTTTTGSSSYTTSDSLGDSATGAGRRI